MRRILAALAPLLLACPGTLENDDPEFYVQPLACPDVVQEILLPRCSSVRCHGNGPASQAGLDLKSPDLPDRLVGVMADCVDEPLVNAEEPEASVLYRKVGPAPPCGDRMPYSGQGYLTPHERACVLAWIRANLPP